MCWPVISWLPHKVKIPAFKEEDVLEPAVRRCAGMDTETDEHVSGETQWRVGVHSHTHSQRHSRRFVSVNSHVSWETCCFSLMHQSPHMTFYSAECTTSCWHSTNLAPFVHWSSMFVFCELSKCFHTQRINGMMSLAAAFPLTWWTSSPCSQTMLI